LARTNEETKMKTLLITLSTLTVGLGALTSLSARETDPGEHFWRQDLEAARADARAQGKPLLIVFR
jgi:hypothetical protein